MLPPVPPCSNVLVAISLPFLLPSFLICLTSVARGERPPTSGTERLRNLTGCPRVSLVCRTTNSFHRGGQVHEATPCRGGWEFQIIFLITYFKRFVLEFV
jgi:hypothetical protein